ncbi:MAG: NosD domain-containing protein, partial [Promethearchaeota archaeon]
NGFGLYWSNSCILTGNTATSNYNEGFGFWYFDSCTLTNNTATSNTYYGFGFSFSTNCTLMDNTAGGNGCGIRLGGSSTGNLLFLNQLFNSTQSNGCDDGSSNSWDNGTHGNFWDDYDGSGTYPILGSAGSVDNHPYVLGALVDTTPPTIDSPSDIEYEHGTTDHSIVWTPDDLNPQSYAIYLNGTEVRSGAWNSTSETITISVDGLAIGAYNYTVVLHDTSGNSANDTVLVTVVDTTAPTIDHPSDLVYETGTLGHWITWSPSDPYPDSYEVLRNGTPLTSAPWDGSTIAISVDGLSVGVYNYTVLVTDTHSNLASDTVLVTVFAVTTTTTTATTTTTTDTTTSTTSTTTTTTTTTTGTDMIGGQDPMVLLITAGAIGGVVVVLLVIYIKRSR